MHKTHCQSLRRHGRCTEAAELNFSRPLGRHPAKGSGEVSRFADQGAPQQRGGKEQNKQK